MAHVGQRSRALENFFACLNFRSFYFRIRDGAYEIYKLAPYENFPLYGMMTGNQARTQGGYMGAWLRPGMLWALAHSPPRGVWGNAPPEKI
jgi:hypothetical protein